uniref:synaptotagmin-5-like n=1 Tax=Styela clava TaxID=7725 RepID=UPI001939C378|nr:synaptotagmin-5-like [Styela clava]
MALGPGIIAGIVIAAIIATLLVAVILYYLMKKSKEDEDDSCTKLMQKYGTTKHKAGQRSEMVANYPEVTATFTKSHVAGQQFTARELQGTDDTGFVIPMKEGDPTLQHSMYRPIDPGNIDPRLYAVGGSEIEGSQTKMGKRPAQVIFTVEYDSKFSILKICILEARHLRPSSSSGTSDPYCTVAVKPGHAAKKSQVFKNTSDPIFNENFSFEVQKNELNDKTIELNFFDFDQYSRDELTGSVNQKLSEIELKDEKIDLWRRITLARPDTSETPEEYGDILLRLGYLPSAEKLTVVLLKARNLKCFSETGDVKQPDPYIRVAILHDGHLLKKKKTSTKRKTANPTYNQAINFAVPLDVLPRVEIQFHIVNDTGVKLQRGSRKETIGYLEIGPHSTGDEYDHWVDLMSKKPQARWHRLREATHDVDEQPSTASETATTSK